jgi:hypothetical protein
MALALESESPTPPNRCKIPCSSVAEKENETAPIPGKEPFTGSQHASLNLVCSVDGIGRWAKFEKEVKLGSMDVNGKTDLETSEDLWWFWWKIRLSTVVGSNGSKLLIGVTPAFGTAASSAAVAGLVTKNDDKITPDLTSLTTALPSQPQLRRMRGSTGWGANIGV